MQSNSTDRIIAITVAVLLHAALLLTLLFSFLRYPPADRDPLEFQDEKPEISFENIADLLAGGDIVALGDNLDDGLSDLPAPAPETVNDQTQDAPDLNNAGPAAVPDPLITGQDESPVKIKETPKPEKQGPTKEEIEAAEEAKRQQQMRQNIAERIRFGGGHTGTGTSGQADGNTASGAAAGSPSVEGLAGYTLQSFSKVRSTSIGTIAIDVTVDIDGAVTEAAFNASRSLNTARTDKSLIERCRQSALQSKFSVPVNTTRQRSGTILYHFK